MISLIGGFMVNQTKIKYYLGRIELLERNAKTAIKNTYADKATDYRSMIRDGCGKLKTDKQIREVIGDLSSYACPIVIEVSRLFDFEREKIIKEITNYNTKMSEKRIAEYKKLDKDFLEAKDLVYLGTETDLLNKLKEIEKKYKIKEEN